MENKKNEIVGMTKLIDGIYHCQITQGNNIIATGKDGGRWIAEEQAKLEVPAIYRNRIKWMGLSN